MSRSPLERKGFEVKRGSKTERKAKKRGLKLTASQKGRGGPAGHSKNRHRGGENLKEPKTSLRERP